MKRPPRPAKPARNASPTPAAPLSGKPARKPELEPLQAPLALHARVPGSDPLTLTATEWVLTNSLGGFAMGTAGGIPTRRYHALLASDTPESSRRRVMLSALVERLVIRTVGGEDEIHDLSTFRFAGDNGAGVVHPAGHTRLVRFEKDVCARWIFRAGPVEVVKEALIPRRTRSVLVRYTVRTLRGAVAEARLELRPLVAMRDYHSLLRASGNEARFAVQADEKNTTSKVRVAADGVTLSLSTDKGEFRPSAEWWNNFFYAVERDRGQDCVEDLFVPGVFSVDLAVRKAPLSIVFHATADPREGAGSFSQELEHKQTDAQELAAAVVARATAASDAEREQLAALAVASDDFVVRTHKPVTVAGETGGEGESRVPDKASSIIAGYPWFTDWGRDTMISLPGLLLETGRYAEALSALRRFAGARRNGIIPNRFTDVGAEHEGHAGATGMGEPEYNTIDASLWFIIAACRYLEASRDSGGFQQHLLPACLDVVDHYRRGTDFGIGMDPTDFLIAGGSPTTQLTWMDARRDGICFTPRHGKPVEISALWHTGLRLLAGTLSTTDQLRAADLRSLADAVASSFRTSFYNSELGCCFDVISRDDNGRWRGVPEIRPNQLFAVSLPHSPLLPIQQAAVVRTVREKLLTPVGVRTLSPDSPGYRPYFQGSLLELDAAYHNGTVWPWLLGSYAEAVARTGNFTTEAITEAKGALLPIIRKLDAECVGQIAEVFDAEPRHDQPQHSGGCPAQAWSVAETLRVYAMLLRPL
ncbi:MAG: glycogen debranching enzyme family protein [Pyrinomonadaceae bacterium]|nr:glycogen debranching enzyme family protein [Phycisphaerales bacterium]